MIERRLAKQLGRVARRQRSLALLAKLSLVWLAGGLIGGLVLCGLPGLAAPQRTAALLAASASLLAVGLAWRSLRRGADLADAARRVEACYPDLDARLLAAVAQQPDNAAGSWGYLQFAVIGEALAHGRRDGWRRATPLASNLGMSVCHAAALAFFGTILIGLARQNPAAAHSSQPPRLTETASAPKYQATIEPGDVELERGTSLLALARFAGELPADVTLVYKPVGGREERLAMSKSLDDPLFAGRVADVQTDLAYHVEFGGERSSEYRATVFDYPDLERADIKLAPPAYTGQGETLVEDTLQVAAVEGTALTLLARLNQEVAKAELTAAERPAIPLAADPHNPRLYTATLPLTKTTRYKLHLVDAAGRRNKEPAEFSFTALKNRPPEIKLVFPSRDVQVSPLEEIELQANMWDDFGLQAYGIAYSLDGEPPHELVLGEHTAAKEHRDARHLVSFEKFAAQPDQLLTYYFFADDVGPDGQVRRTSSDMFFCEVRPFEEIFRQGDTPPGSASAEQAGNDADKLAELQKQVITATWKLVRREIGAQPSAAFAKDAPVLLEGEQEVLRLADELETKLRDPLSLAHLDTARRHMRTAIEHLQATVSGPAVARLQPALAAEQAAYQALLKLRAREHVVVRGNPQGSSSGSQRASGQLSQLELKDSENRYEQRRTADQQEDEAQRETRQVLNRLRELAERQQDLNARIKELQSSLEGAESREQQEEIRRQLKRLRDEQQQILRDADELLSRMDQPNNQQRMSEARQQLDRTRANVRQTSEALQAGQPQQAAAAGTRAQEQLEHLRDEFRKQAAGRFSDEMRAMRQEARQLEKQEQDVARQLADLQQPKSKSLREPSGREELRERLAEQRSGLDKLIDAMRKTVEEAESSEPLLAKQLYDTVRQAHQQRPGEALDTTRQLLERGFFQESHRFEQQAQAGISRVKEGVERAAESVLGDEAEAIRRARDEVQQLASAIDQEMRRATGQPPENESQQAGQQLGQENQSGQPNQQGQPNRPGQSGQQGQPGQQGPAGKPPAPGSDQGRDQPGQPGKNAGENPSDPGQGKPAEGKPAEGKPDQGKPGQGKPGQGKPGEGKPGDGKPGESGEGASPGNPEPGQSPPGPPNPSPRQSPGKLPSGQSATPPAEAQAQEPSRSPGKGTAPAGARQSAAGGGSPRGGGVRQLLGEGTTGPGGPLTGGDFRPWADRLRDVEEMLDDPQLRAEAARIRDRAAAMRAEFKRHSQQPNWDLVRETIYQPLAELRGRLAEELLKRESHDALVPLDRDPVPPGYSDQVRRYYERLGSGK